MANESRNDEKIWVTPSIYILDFKDTRGGNNPEKTEDIEYDQNSLE